MSAKHTPAPWSVPHFARPEVNCACEYVLADGYMGAVATVHSSGEGDWKLTGDNPKYDEAVANARLIAAAPELLEAMEGIVHFRDALNWRDDHLSKALRQWIDAGASAIAKATGSVLDAGNAA